MMQGSSNQYNTRGSGGSNASQGQNSISNGNLLTASLQAKVSNLKSLSDAFKDLEKKNNKKPASREVAGMKLEVNGTATFGKHNTIEDSRLEEEGSSDMMVIDARNFDPSFDD